MNLGTGRIVVIVVLVVGGVAVLINGFSGSPAAAPTGGSSTSTSTPPPTSASTTSPPVATPSPQAPTDTTIAVFNGTTTTGLGAQGQQMLTNAGYVAPTDAQNAPTTGIKVTTIYYRGGAAAAQNKSDATFMAKKHFKGAKVALLGSDFASLIQKDVQLAVVLGEDYAATAGA